MKRLAFISSTTLALAVFSAIPAFAEEPSVADTLINLAYSIDTFYFLMSGALVMWMACGFAMLDAGLVRSKNTTEILTKNVVLFAVACTAYLVVGYDIMYDGGVFLKDIALDGAANADALTASVLAESVLCHEESAGR